MENRLQFIHCDTYFPTAQEAIDYVNERIILKGLYAEPMVVRYGSEENPNIILAIGSVGNGETAIKNKAFFIDFASVKESIDSIVADKENSKDEITSIKNIIGEIVKSCGLTEEGKYEADSEDYILEEALSLKDADKKLSEYILSLENKVNANKVSTEDTPTIVHTLNNGENGTVLSSEVRIAPYRIVGHHNWDNIILRQADGLYANVRLYYNEEDNKVYFGVNDNEQVLNLPTNVTLKSGRYDTDSENLILTMSDESEVKINVSRLIGEWKVQGEDSKTPIVLKKEVVKNIEDFRNGNETQDILTADVRIAGVDKYTGITDNILQRYEGDTLYVKGTAENIIFYDKNGNKTTVQDALQNARSLISIKDNNIIVEKEDGGIYATVQLNYNESTNALTFDNGIGEPKVIQLNAGGVVNRAYYDSTNERIVVVFELADGKESTVEVPVGDLIEEWDVDNTYKTVTLTRKRQAGAGHDTLSADVNISDNDDNILTVSNHSLYVKGTASNIKYGNTNVQDALDKINGGEGVEGSIKNLIKAEKDERVASDKKLNQAIVTEVERAKEAEHANTVAIAELKNTVSGNTSDIASLKETVANNASEISTVKENLNTLNTNFTHFSSTTNSAIEEVKSSNKSLAEKVDAAEANIEKNKADLQAEVQRATARENEIEKKLQDHIDNTSTDIEEDLKNLQNTVSGLSSEVTTTKASIEKEIEDRKAADEAINTSVSNLTNDVKANTENIATVKDDLNTLNQSFTQFSGNASTVHQQLADSVKGLNETVTNVSNQTNTLSGNVTTLTENVNGLSTKVNELQANTGNITNTLTSLDAKIDSEITRATNREDAIEKALNDHIDSATADIENDVTKIKEDIEALKLNDTSLGNSINAEAQRAKSEEARIEGMVEAANSAISAETDRATKVESELKSAIESNDTDINTLSANVFTNTTDIASIKAENARLTIIPQETNTVKINSSKTESGTNLSADVKVKSATDNIILTDGNGIYANVRLDYNKATNAIALVVNGSVTNSFELSDHSIVQEGHYDSNTKEIILTIVKDGGQTEQIHIPVADIINEWKVDNGTNNPISLSKTSGADGVDVLKAELEISTEAHNAILNNNGTLYVSNQAKDLTALWGGDEITLQKAIENLKGETDKVGDISEEFDSLKNDMTQVKSDINQVKEDLSALEDKVNQNTTNISKNTGDITNLNTRVDNLEDQFNNKFDALEGDVNDLTDKVNGFDDRITAIEGDLQNVNNSISEINQIINDIKEQIGDAEEGQANINDRLNQLEEIVNNLIDFGTYPEN